MTDNMMSPSGMLKTRRLCLRPIRLEDVPALFSYGKMPEVAKLAGFPVNQSLNEVESLIARNVKKAEDDLLLIMYVIVRLTDNHVIGTVNFTRKRTDDVYEMATQRLGVMAI